MKKGRSFPGNRQNIEKMLADIHADRRAPRFLIFVLLLLYLAASFFIPRISQSAGMLRLGSKMLPVSSFAGVLSSLANICTILIVMFYGKLGFCISLGLSLLQFALQIRGIIQAPVLSMLPGVFSNILAIVAIVVIYTYNRQMSVFQQKLRDQAVVDSLTGLPNRFAASMLMEQLIHDREKFIYVSIDLNNFKGINDMMGHEAGDHVLTALADRWKAVAASAEGTRDFIGRISGDEFVLILRNYDSGETALRAIERYRAELEKTLTVDDCDYHLQASLGYAEYPTDAATRDALITYAEAAMTKIKGSGEDRKILRFTSDLLTFEREMEIKQKILTALEQDHVFFHLQPQYDISHRLRGFEALARLKDENGNMISPGEFIPIAEKAGLVNRIDSAVFRKASAFFGDLLLQTRTDLTLSVNVSVQHLMRNDFLDEVKKVLAENRVPAKQIEIEITESIMIDSAENAFERINELKGLGLKIAIDDFGTGYSSLSYLNQIPADILKVDKSFIDRMNSNDSSRKYVASIISIGHIMNLDVIAEGVEENDQMETLREIGCDFIQGFIWGRPMPPEEAAKIVA